MKRVALLATGDEIINGDILNTNGQIIAELLIHNGIQPGMHMVASDDQDELEAAMAFLLSHHDALITIGGLGPTSDDRTRFALANTLKQPLNFDEASWQQILERLKRFNLNIPESNRQQCMFPEGATIIENTNGTANACKLIQDQHYIYMLPGPPNECLPLFKDRILPDLLNSPLAKKEERHNWLLFGVSEGSIAETLDALVAPFDVTIGYRVAYPYLEVKLHSHNTTAFEQASTALLEVIRPHIISEQRKHASTQLHNSISQQHQSLHIEDHVTGGLLESALLSPSTHNKVSFHTNDKHLQDIHIQISGLDEYWNKHDDADSSQVTVTITQDNKSQTLDITVPYGGARMKGYAMEAICVKLLDYF